jgi:hypothetical protein
MWIKVKLSHIFQKIGSQMAVRLPSLRANRTPFAPKKIPGTHFSEGLSRPQSHRADRRIRSLENFNDIENRTRNLPACIIVRAQFCVYNKTGLNKLN